MKVEASGKLRVGERSCGKLRKTPPILGKEKRGEKISRRRCAGLPVIPCPVGAKAEPPRPVPSMERALRAGRVGRHGFWRGLPGPLGSRDHG